MIDMGTVTNDILQEYANKLDITAKQGDRLELIRRDDNPDGKWLVRDSNGMCKYLLALAQSGDSSCPTFTRLFRPIEMEWQTKDGKMEPSSGFVTHCNTFGSKL